jgi:hypothetical protein
MSNPAFLKKMKKVNRKEVEEADDDELENEDEDEAAEDDSEENAPQLKGKGATPNHPVVGKHFTLKHVIHAVPDDTSPVDHSTHDPLQSSLFKGMHDHAKQSLDAGPHHHALHKFHNTAKKMIDANYPEPKHKKATIKKIKEKWLGGK